MTRSVGVMRDIGLGACLPQKAFFRPGEPAKVRFRLRDVPARVCLTVTNLHGVVHQDEVTVDTPEYDLSFPLPSAPGRGYGVEISVLDRENRVRARQRTAVDVQRSWMDAPRYGFLSDFAPGTSYEERCDGLLARHITAVQFYDWMFRHYQFLPPQQLFTDALGRDLSLRAVRDAIESVRRRGMAALAYGALYGAEPEFALRHPDEVLYDETGRPISLVDMFYIMDLRPGPWRDRILEQFRLAVELGFDGIHADQYGFPDRAWDRGGNALDMAPIFADVVEAAQATVRGAGGDGVIFNHVRNWPIRAVAPVAQCATYVEIWPPYEQFHDLVRLISEAGVLAPERQIILAAYMSCATPDPAAAEEATLLTASVIHAAGGFHLLLGEGDAILADPYYPNFVRPPHRFQQRLTDHWDFIVRYGAYLHDGTLRLWEGEPVKADAVWPIYRVGERFSTLSLINARPDEHWDAVHAVGPAHRQVLLDLPITAPVGAVYAASPDLPGDAASLAFESSATRLRLAVPVVRTWTLIIIEHDSIQGR